MPKPWTERFGFLRQPASSKANSQPGQQTGSKAKSKTTNQQAGSKTSPLTRQIGSNRLLRRFLIILAIVAIPLLLLLYWWYHPPINIHSEGTWGFIILFILVPAWIIFRFRALLAQRDASTQSNRPQELDESGRLKATAIDKDKAKKAGQIAVLFKRLSWIPVGGLVVFLIGSLLSSPIFPGNAVRYADILVVETRDFSTDIKEVNYAEIPVIDRESATLLGNRVMGEIPEYVSQFVINPLYSQINFRGKPVRISPLDYADLFKWFTNRNTGLPGYVLIDMATQDSKIMRLDAPMLYSQSEPLGRNIDRHVQLSFPFYMFDQKSIEIDEDGHPWWVCPVQTRRIGLFGGTDITRVVLCDAATGECIDLSIDECPKWVDRVYPADLVLAQYNWHGAYQKGWINSWLGQEGVVQTTPGTNGQLGYNYIAKDDDVWVYTGITSAVSDSSIVGFVLINQRTAEARFYPMSGATEESAMYSAQGQVQHLRYQSTFPLLVNVHGQPTYFMALKDNAGLVKMYAMLDIQRYQNVAVGDSVAECQVAYLTLLAESGVIARPDDWGEDSGGTGSGTGGTSNAGGTGSGTGDSGANLGPTSTATGTVTRIATAVIDGNSHFYLTLADDSNIYDCALPELLAVLQIDVGQSVRLTYRQAEGVRIVQSIGLLP